MAEGSSILYNAFFSKGPNNEYLEGLVKPVFSNDLSNCTETHFSHEIWKYCLPGTGGPDGPPCDDGTAADSKATALKEMEEDDLLLEYYNFHKRISDSDESFWVKFRDGEGDVCSADEAITSCKIRADSICETAFNDVNTNPRLPMPISKLLSTVIVFLVMLGCILYATLMEKRHQERVRKKNSRQEDVSTKVSPSGIGSETSDDDSINSNSSSAAAIKEREKIKFQEAMESSEKEAGNLRWWDINFDSQEMEDLYRKTQAEKHLFQLRIFVILNSLFTFVYSKYMVDGRVNWELRGLLFFFSFLVLPLTIPSVYGKFHVFGDFMLSSVLIIFSCVVVMICFMDLFDGVPTNGYLFMAVLMLLNLTIMYITGTNWFRKMLIILVTLVFYLITVTSYSTACYGLSYEQDYPIVQLIPTKEYFRYQFNCNDYDKFYDLIKQIGFSQMNILLVVYSGYFQEKQKRQEFARKWFLVKGKFNMEKRLKKMSDAEKKRNTQKKGINFGEMRELNFKSPLMKVLATLEKIKIAVSDNDSVMEALNMVETTLKTTDDLNKIDIHKQDLDAGDREFAKFLLSAGGKGHVLRDRVRSVPSLVGVRIEDNEELRSKECGLLTAIGLPDGTRVFGKEHLKALDYLTKYEQWDFDVHLLSAMTNKRPVYYLFCKAMERFYEPFELCLQEMKAFILYVEETYCFDPNQHNPYHNHLHSADVLQTTGYFLNAPFCQQKLGSLDKMATLIAAMMHDYRHKGVNNAYIVNCSPPDELALVHNDLSVLERFHASETFILLNTQKFKANFLANMVSSDYRYLRTSCIEMILATDLSHGYKYIGKFGTKCKAGQDQWGDKQEDILILMQMVIKAADVSHPSKTLNLHKTWTVMITDEFFSQGDLERSNKMTLSPLCDRYINDDIPKSQIGFIDFVVKPTVQPLSNLLKLDEIMKNLTNNYKYWCELVRNQSGLDTSLASLRLEVRTLSDALIKSNGVVLDEHGNNKKLSGAAEAGDEAP